MRVFPDWVEGDVLGLDPDTFHHVVSVQRTRVGECLSWGVEGQLWRGEVVAIEPPDRVRVGAVSQQRVTEEGGRWTVIQCLPKGDKFAEIVRGLVECGVHRIIPVMATRSIGQGSDHRVDRWQRVLKSAAMQANRVSLPVVTPVMSWEGALQQGGVVSNRVVAWEEAPRGAWVTAPLEGDWVVVIGPEGGLTAPEIALATEQGYKVVSLGESVIRVERAGIVAISMLQGYKMGVGIATNTSSS